MKTFVHSTKGLLRFCSLAALGPVCDRDKFNRSHNLPERISLEQPLPQEHLSCLKTYFWALILFIPDLLANLPSLPTDGLNQAVQYPVFKEQTKLIHYSSSTWMERGKLKGLTFPSLCLVYSGSHEENCASLGLNVFTKICWIGIAEGGTYQAACYLQVILMPMSEITDLGSSSIA